MSSDGARRSSLDEGVVRKRGSNSARYLKYYFGGLLIAVLIETIMFLMTYSGFKSTWGLLVMFCIWVVLAVSLLVWFVIRDDAAHDEHDARRVPLTISELFLFQEPLRDGDADVDAVSYRRHTRRVAHVRVCIVVLVAWMAGALIGLGSGLYFEQYWHYTQPGSHSTGSSGTGGTTTGSAVKPSAAWGNVNADTDPTTMPGAKAIYFVGDQVEPSTVHGGAALVGATFHCVMPMYFPGGQAPSEVNFWAVAKGCCTLNTPGRVGEPVLTCDTTGRLGMVVDGTPYRNAVANAQQKSHLGQVNAAALYVELVSEGAYEHAKYLSKVSAWVLFGVLPPLWPAGLLVVLLIKVAMDSCGCNTKNDDPDACRCCS